jgi:hypothetical protein
MNREHLKPFRVMLEAGNMLRGFDSFRGANIFARRAARKGTAGDITILSRAGKILATTSRDAGDRVWTDHTNGMRPPLRRFVR